MNAADSRRRAGVLLHVTSLPGSGTFADGPAFVDFLADAGCTVWQVLPLVPTHPRERSPYDAPSAMAISPDLIGPVSAATGTEEEFVTWAGRNGDWLDAYAQFTVLQDLHDQVPWWEWPVPLRDRDTAAVAAALRGHKERVEQIRRQQWLADQQWQDVRAVAAEQGVLIFGDLPIFVSADSADVWAHRDQFCLDAAGRPITVTGVPPDYFAADGQKWNNPHYDWEQMASDGYAWWRCRIARQRELFDIVRIDHFRGLAAAWHVAADAPNARDGEWVAGPGQAIVDVLLDEAGPGHLVAEDLGLITPDVEALRTNSGLPGMKVLQFAFDGTEQNPHRLERHGEDAVVYTGTHDNPTTLGWWESAPPQLREQVRAVLIDPAEDMPWALIRLAFSSTARLAVVPAQDLLGLDERARMNTPGVALGNWTWQAPEDSFTPALARRVAELVKATDRA